MLLKGALLLVALAAPLALSSASASAAPSATLRLQPAQGPASARFTATYTFAPDAAVPCPKGAVSFTWDGREVLGPAQPLTQTELGCQAVLSSVAPSGVTTAAHEVCGSYTAPASAVGPAGPAVTACGTFTVSAPAPSPTSAPTATTAPPTRTAAATPRSSPSLQPSPSPSPSPNPALGPIRIANSASGSSAPGQGSVALAPAATPRTAPTLSADTPGLSTYVGWIVPAGVAVVLLSGLGAGFVLGRRRPRNL